MTKTVNSIPSAPGDADTGRLTLTSRQGGPEISLDPQTGLPTAFASQHGGPSVPIRLGLELATDGEEVIPTTGGLTYLNTRRHVATDLVPDSLRHTTNGPTERYVLETESAEWLLRTTITFRPEHPRVELRVAASPREGQDGEGALRSVYLNADFDEDMDAWLVEAPGNRMRPGVSAAAISEPVAIETTDYHLGSPGVVALHHADEALTFVMWPMSRSEQGPTTLLRTESGLRIRVDTQLAGALRPGEWIEHGPIYLDVLARTWADVRDDVHTWYQSISVQTPRDSPAWCSSASLYEVMIGSAPFRGGYQYAPYPSLQDLVDDLDRIADLGFDCLQLMPQHPYPSYNIHQPGDVATTYAAPADLRMLVEECHRRDLRIVLDILLHGVIDKQVMEKTARLVREGPYAHRLDDPCLDVFGEERTEISWSRHILEFEPHWHAGAPDHHRMLDTHPYWFMRDSNGAITGRYTHALDIANHDWQDYFIGTCEALVRDYGIDGFRFDAPSYNLFANWSASARRHASYSNLGYVELFRRLRHRLHDITSDLMLYTEPSGPLARESLDLNYGYPESWLIASLFEDRLDRVHDWRRVRNGRQLANWFRDFDATLPSGSATAHFVDCHDTIWWRLPGDLWRREQVGLPATKALIAIYGLRGGGYLTCAGAETGIETELRRMLALRAELPEIRDGAVDYGSVRADADAVYTVLRRDHTRATLIAVNTSAQAIQTPVHVDTGSIPGQIGPELLDAWSGQWISAPPASSDTTTLELTLEPYQTRVIVLGEPPRELRP